MPPGCKSLPVIVLRFGDAALGLRNALPVETRTVFFSKGLPRPSEGPWMVLAYSCIIFSDEKCHFYTVHTVTLEGLISCCSTLLYYK